MAGFDYSGLRATAVRLIDGFGRTITKKVITNSGVKWDPTQASEDIPIIGVFTNFSKSEIDGTLILSTDKKILTYDEVDIDNKILDQDIVYSVIAVDLINPGDTKLIYKVQVRI